MRPKFDFDQSPYLILWELTRACALACKHCRAKAMKRRAPEELSLSEICKVLDRLQTLSSPLIVFTGGDPSERPDLFEIIAEAKRRNIVVAITPSATVSMSKDFVSRLKQFGVERLAISLDGADCETHDAFRGVKGSFEITRNIIEWAREAALPIQINTTVSRFNIDQFDRLSSFVSESNAVLWSLFFLIPTGRANNNMQISAAEAELLMMKMADLADQNLVDIKATAAPHFRRVLIQSMQEKSESTSSARNWQNAGAPIQDAGLYFSNASSANVGATPCVARGQSDSNGDKTPSPDSVVEGSIPNTSDIKCDAKLENERFSPTMRLGRLRSYQSVNDGKGIMFISHTGEIYPSGFLPLSAGNVRTDDVLDVYRNSTVFKELRNPDLLKGKCGACRYKAICGGSRARAFAETGDYLMSDTLCPYDERAVVLRNENPLLEAIQ